MIANLDENLGKLDAFLRESGLYEDTIVIFMTDNGATGGFKIHNSGMRGRKTQIYDGGHRVPCFIRWPKGNLRGPADVDTPAQIQDVLPTLIDLCALKKPARAKFDGASLAPLLRDKQPAFADRMMVVQYGQILKKWDSNVIWSQWRLVNGTELYDFRRDPAEENDQAVARPEVVKKMRAHYEQWWAGIEPTLRDFCPISVGAPQENPVELSCSDWQEVYCDNINAVLTAQGGPRGGPWNIEVERAGDYEIALARWPFFRDLALSAACPAKKMTVATLPEGKALAIAQARLQVGGHDLTGKAAADAKHVRFRVKLVAGKTLLHGWFQDADGQDLSGAYYARVRRL